MDNNSLFDNGLNILTFDDVINSLNVILKKIEIEKELPEGCLYIRDNISKVGKLTSRSICIHEPYYPAPYGDEIHDNWIETVITFSFKESSKEGKYCEFNIREDVFDKIGMVGLPKVFYPSKNSNLMKLRYFVNNSAFFEFIDKCVRHAVEHYSSFDDLFSCCHRYVQCSDAKKCLHPNKLYSTACVYRHNLERGHIFYGKNKNTNFNMENC